MSEQHLSYLERVLLKAKKRIESLVNENAKLSQELTARREDQRLYDEAFNEAMEGYLNGLGR